MDCQTPVYVIPFDEEDHVWQDNLSGDGRRLSLGGLRHPSRQLWRYCLPAVECMRSNDLTIALLVGLVALGFGSANRGRQKEVKATGGKEQGPKFKQSVREWWRCFSNCSAVYRVCLSVCLSVCLFVS